MSVKGPSSNNAQQVDHDTRYGVERAADGTVRAYKYNSSAYRVWTIILDQLTAAQKNSLISFFNTEAEGPNNTFDYTHTNGTTYSTVRFMDTELRFQKILPSNEWSVTVRLLVSTNI